ncbi:glycosyltransferase family 4 protein [Sphingomonas mucosissima]|nr:glycosyltransferase family 1 protein [Sphingomonas mucosissima]
MRDALAATGPSPLILEDDQRGRFGVRASLRETIQRHMMGRLRSRLLLARDARRLYAPDVYRLAQARFSATGQLLILDAPGPPGIMHWTYPIPAWIRGWVNFYTIHDAIPMLGPELSGVAPDPLQRRIMAIGAVADRFLTVSDAARDQILSAFRLHPSSMANCGAAITALAPGDGHLPGNLRTGEYYLFCGLGEPRKNLPRLIAAWRASGTPFPLVLTGPDHDPAQREPGLIILPYQERQALIDLMRHARALLFPSLGEGFGLPVVEAMALGTPVLTANNGALAEVANGSALLVDPLDEEAIARGIGRLDHEDELRATLASLGRDRSRAFTVDRFGARLRQLHNEFTSDSRLDV